MTITKANHTYTVGFSFEKFEFDNSFNLGAYGYSNANGYVGAFGSFGSVNRFFSCLYKWIIAEALSNAQAVKGADSGL